MDLNLLELGWNDFFATQLPDGIPADQSLGRVVAEHKQSYVVLTEAGEYLSQLSGKLRHNTQNRGDLPAVGDWVQLSVPSCDQAIIHQVLPRQSKFSRKAAGPTTEEQVIAANMDVVFIVCGLNQDFNVRRLERYLTLAWDSGARPVVVLSKCDLSADVPAAVAEVRSAAPGVPVYAISCLTGEGVDELLDYLGSGQTAVFLGSSGAGKSTLINRLLGQDAMQVGEVRAADGRGRHTTTHRQLLFAPGFGMLIDTPGMRELQLWGADDGLQSAFAEISQLASGCRFADCTHTDEPGCAVQQALRSGQLDPDRYASFIRLGRELAFLARKESVSLALAEKQRMKARKQRIRQEYGRNSR